MTWQRMASTLAWTVAGCIAFDAFVVAAWLVAVDLKTRQSRRARDKPIKGDDTILRIERSGWPL